MKLFKLSCPSCGGTLSYKTGTEICECPYCDSKYLIEADYRRKLAKMTECDPVDNTPTEKTFETDMTPERNLASRLGLVLMMLIMVVGTTYITRDDIAAKYFGEHAAEYVQLLRLVRTLSIVMLFLSIAVAFCGYIRERLT